MDRPTGAVSRLWDNAKTEAEKGRILCLCDIAVKIRNNNGKPIVNRKILNPQKCRCFIGKVFLLSCAYDFLITRSTCTSRSAYRLAAARKIKTLYLHIERGAWNRLVIPSASISRRASAPARRAGMTESGVKPSNLIVPTPVGSLWYRDGDRRRNRFSSCRGWPDRLWSFYSLLLLAIRPCTCSAAVY